MIDIKDLSYHYKGTEPERGLRSICLTVGRGELLLLCGESGCGKTTLTRLINGLIPNFYEGTLEGRVRIGGKNVDELPLFETGKIAGSVFQNPRSQFFNVDSTSEIAFGCENRGMEEGEIRRRIDGTVKDFKIESLLERNLFHLSGGEKQKIACASVSAVGPEIMVLDEPSSNLDSAGVEDLRAMIEIWKSEGRTVIIAEHRLYYLRDLFDRVVYMKNGGIDREFNRLEFQSLEPSILSELGLRPLHLESLDGKKEAESPSEIFHLTKFQFSYNRSSQVLSLPDVPLPRGGSIAVIGSNGAGKTTFARCLCGLNRKFKGEILSPEKIEKGRSLLKNSYMVMQDVNHQLFAESVLDEVLLSMKNENEKKAEEVLEDLDLLDLKDRHPMSLSGGQKQRVAIASAVASERERIIFDEPTSGLDLRHMKEVACSINSLRKRGKTIFVISHDLEFILECCSHVIHLEKGLICDSYPLDQRGRKQLKNDILSQNRSRVPDSLPVMKEPVSLPG